MRLRFVLACLLAAAALPSSARAQPADWGAVRDPFDRTIVARYKAILAKNPHDPSALAKLLELYRRYRTVDLLKQEYEKSEDWAGLVVQGRLQHSTGDDARALDFFQRAVGKQDGDAAAWLQIGELQKSASKPKDARAAYDQALAHASQKDQKKKALRALADLALAANDTTAADAYFKQFLDLDPTNAQLWIERGDAMLAANQRDVALASYTAAEKLLGADPSRRVEVVARRGQALQGMGKDDEAVAEYRRAIKLAPKGYYLEVELTGRIIDIYRAKQSLAALLAQYEKEWPEGARGHFEWDTLGKLYEETGAQDKAIAALKKAVAKAPYELETQRHLISMLEASGRDDEALAAYEAVVRAAPGQATFQLELADRYWRRGQEKKALDALRSLDARFPGDGGVLAAIADLYTRWGKEDLAIAEYERLAKLEPDDPAHLVTLGEQYWQKNDKVRALATWKRLIASGKAAGFAKLGEVMSEHGNTAEARINFDKAIKLDDKNPEFFKGRAAFLEGQKDFKGALGDWERVLALLKPTDRTARRDARRHHVQLVTRAGGLELAYARQWHDKFAAGDTDAGYFLVEYFARRPQKDQPLKTLEQLHVKVPEDQDVVLDLVKAYRGARRYDEAVAMLLELQKVAQSREREIYQLISEIKTEARKDDEAIEWAQKALAKSQGDPQAYERLGERYVEMQRFPEAIEAYENAVKHDAHDSKAQFALAQLYVQNGDTRKAAELLRTVVRTASDEEVIGRAGNQAIDLEEMTDTLGELEKVISPLSFMMAHKPVYRRVLVKLYLRYVPRLVEHERHGTDDVRKAARAELARISGHGLQPLLEALRDEKESGLQRDAITVLGSLGNKGAASPLVRIARVEPKEPRRPGVLSTDSADRELRVDALVAAGKLGDASVLAEVLPLVDHQDLAMREAATFTLGRSGDRRAVPPLVKALADRRATVQALACLGLAQIDDPRVGPAAIAALADPRRDDAVRAACAYAIGARKIAAGSPALLAALADNRGEAQRLAAWALGQLGDARSLGALVRAYFARAGRADTELVWAIGRATGAVPAGPVSWAAVAEFPPRQGKFDLGKYDLPTAIALVPGPLAPSTAAGAKLVTEHADDIARGLIEALAEHRDVVVAVLSDLDGDPARISLGALSPSGPTGADGKVATALDAIGAQIAPKVAAQAQSTDAKVRALAVSVLAKLDGPRVQLGGGATVEAIVTTALADPSEQVRGAAMQAIATLSVRRGAAPAPLVAALEKAMSSPAWADRRVAALALGQLGPKGDPQALIKAVADPSSFVREAVAISLGRLQASGVTIPDARAVLVQLSHDEVPQVRTAAESALRAP